MSLHAIEDCGAEPDDAPLIVSEYWPTAATDSGRTTEPRLGVPNQPVGVSWWEKTNWFRVHEARSHDTLREEARRALGGSSTQVIEQHPTVHATAHVITHPLHDDNDAPVEYGGLAEEGAQLGDRYGSKINRGIGAALSHGAKPMNEQDRLAAAPGGAEVFCRFVTSTKSSAAATASVVPPSAAAPAPATESVSAKGNTPSGMSTSLLDKAGSGAVKQSTQKVRSKPRIKLQSLQGYDATVKRQVNELVVLPLIHPQVFASLGVKPSRGVLLSGASGAGKTNLVRSIVEELGATIYFQHADSAHLLTELQQDLSAHKASNPKNLESSVGGQNSGGGLGAPKEEGDDVLSKLFATCKKNAPALLFLDEIEQIACAKQQGEQSITAKVRALLRLNLDRLSESHASVLILGATNHPETIDTSLLRTGRFDRSIVLNKPTQEGRYEILKHCMRSMKLDPATKESLLQEISEKTLGFVGSDLANLCTEAGLVCIREYLHSVRQSAMDNEESISDDEDGVTTIPVGIDPATLQNLIITLSHFHTALQSIKPSSTRGLNGGVGEATLKPVQWNEIGGTKEIKNTLLETIEHPLTYPHIFRKYGLGHGGSGVLMYGPPGTGKTLMARAIATQAKASFISVKGPELLTSYLGESEANVRKLFAQAKAASPCVLFLDEVDSIALRRGVQGSDATCDRILNQLLTEMDGRIMGDNGSEDEPNPKRVKHEDGKDATAAAAGTNGTQEDVKMEDVSNESTPAGKVVVSSTAEKPASTGGPKHPSRSSPPVVFVVAATNRPDLLDPALLRPGRLDQLLFVGLPNQESRFDILKTLLKQTPLSPEITVNNFAYLEELSHQRTSRLSGADLAHACNLARKYAIMEFLRKQQQAGVSGKDKKDVHLDATDHVTPAHIDRAFSEVRPSVSDDMLERYKLFNEAIKRGGSVTSVNDVTIEGETAAGEIQMMDSSSATSSPDPAIGSSSSSSSAAKPDLTALREAFRSDILSKLHGLEGSNLTPQQAMNQILGDLLRETNRDSWIPGQSVSGVKRANSGSSASSSSSVQPSSLEDDQPVSLASGSAAFLGDEPARQRRTGGRER